MLVLWEALNGCHTNTAQCAKAEEQKLRRMAVEDMREITDRYLQEYGLPLT